jgi:hypothetical protein
VEASEEEGSGLVELSCSRIKQELTSRDDAYVLLVAEDCPYCEQVLASIREGNVNLDHETFIINTDRCSKEVDGIINWEATPMIAHLKKGREVRRGLGLDGILAFEKDKAKGTGNSTASTPEEREGVNTDQKPPTGMAIEDILRVAEQAPPASDVDPGSGVAHAEQGHEAVSETAEDLERSPQESVNKSAGGVEEYERSD